ncbi:MAG: cation:proton antiporter [Thermoleophilaceae bacterium]|nr:cation:proton antiporter [Thermoleophilaceae bacterium]
MPAVIAMLVILLAWALVAGRLARWNITTAMAMVAAGIALTAGSDPVIRIDLDNTIAERIVEVTLAIVLFVDATEVPGGILGREPRVTLRLVAVALPLSLVLAWAAGFVLFPDQDIWMLALLAVIVVPTDLAPAVAIVRDRRVPARLREILNVEAGLNDGLIAPLFLFCVAAAEATDPKAPVPDALINAVPAVLVALGVGAAVGLLSARMLSRAWSKAWTQPAALRLGVLALPLLAYTLALVLDGNGFVAAFVAGVLFSSSARRLPEGATHLVEDAGTLLSLAVWFSFGQVVNQVIDAGPGVEVIVYAFVALTLVRIIPVALSLVGSGVDRLDALFLGWLGPRGLASIVFGLLAYIDLSSPDNVLPVEVMVVTVLLSVVLHGLTSGPIATAYARRATKAREPAVGDEARAPALGDG